MNSIACTLFHPLRLDIAFHTFIFSFVHRISHSSFSPSPSLCSDHISCIFQPKTEQQLAQTNKSRNNELSTCVCVCVCERQERTQP